MTEVQESTATAPQRRREWVALVGLVLVAATFSVLSPGLLLIVPFALVALALPPRRPLVQIIAIALLVFAFSAHGTGSFWYFERGWTLLIGVWFVVFVLVMPRSGFVNRALGAVAASGLTCAAFFAVYNGRFARLDGEIVQRVHGAAADAAKSFSQVMASKDSATLATLSQNMFKAADMQANFFPAFLALASLAALGVGWWMFRRMAALDAEPLRPLREFRFTDHLVWLLVVGGLLVLLTHDPNAQRTGLNLVIFMAALYALRGVAVLLVLGGAPGPLGVVIGAVLFIVLYPLVMATTMIVGLTDTWLDIRARRRIVTRPGS